MAVEGSYVTYHNNKCPMTVEGSYVTVAQGRVALVLQDHGHQSCRAGPEGVTGDDKTVACGKKYLG